MRKEYSRYIKSKLKEIIPKEFPCFVFLNEQKKYGLDYNFICKDSNNFKMISIQNSHNDDSFMIELFWSNNGEKFQSEVSDFWFESEDDILNIICNETTNTLRVRLNTFYTHEFGSWWAIDPTGKIIKSINTQGFITSEAYFQFYSEDSFLADETNLNEEEMRRYVDPLISNAVQMLKKYGIPLFECLDKK